MVSGSSNRDDFLRLRIKLEKLDFVSRYRFIEISSLEGSRGIALVVFIAVITRHRSQSSPLPLLLASCTAVRTHSSLFPPPCSWKLMIIFWRSHSRRIGTRLIVAIVSRGSLAPFLTAALRHGHISSARSSDDSDGSFLVRWRGGPRSIHVVPQSSTLVVPQTSIDLWGVHRGADAREAAACLSHAVSAGDGLFFGSRQIGGIPESGKRSNTCWILHSLRTKFQSTFARSIVSIFDELFNSSISRLFLFKFLRLDCKLPRFSQF